MVQREVMSGPKVQNLHEFPTREVVTTNKNVVIP